MNIESTKLELMQLLLNTNKASVLARIKTLFEEEGSDWWSELSLEEKKEIEKGEKEANEGHFISNETVMKQFEPWN